MACTASVVIVATDSSAPLTTNLNGSGAVLAPMGKRDKGATMGAVTVSGARPTFLNTWPVEGV